MTATHKHTCLLTRDDRDDALAQMDEHAERLTALKLTRRYCLKVEQARGTWQLWLHEYERGDDE